MSLVSLLDKRFLVFFFFLNLSTISAAAEDLREVSVVTPSKMQAVETIKLSGSFVTLQQSSLSPRVDGLVEHVQVDIGSKVKKGDVLLRLDKTLASHAVAQAKADSAEVKARNSEASRLFNESMRLREKKFISATEVEKRKSELTLSQASLAAAIAIENTAQEQLDRHVLFAPFDGVISAKNTEIGEWVGRGDAVLTLVATDKIRLEVKVPQERFSDIQYSNTVEIKPDQYPQQVIAGQIDAIVPVSDALARAFLVRIKLDHSSLELLPGTSASATIGFNDKNITTLKLPKSAVLQHPDGGHSVFVINDSKAERRHIQVGQQSGSEVTVVKGLSVDDQVVFRGNEVLQEGQTVKIK
ncbi:MAG: efflux RND transporter periplasmic adaptor subunit [Neptuniibacter sp.]